MELLKVRIHQHLEQDYTGSHLKGFVAGMKILAGQARKEEKSDTMHQTGTKDSFKQITKSYKELIDRLKSSVGNICYGHFDCLLGSRKTS